mgnify:CR=1 FL=1
MLPPTPPPEVDLEAWGRTIDELERRAPSRLALIHFGVVADVERHLEELRRRLHAWAERVRARRRPRRSSPRWLAADLAADQAAYEQAMPFWQSYAGLKRYWEKRAA